MRIVVKVKRIFMCWVKLLDFLLPDQTYLVSGNLACACVPVLGKMHNRLLRERCNCILVIRQADSSELSPHHTQYCGVIPLDSRILSIVILNMAHTGPRKR